VVADLDGYTTHAIGSGLVLGVAAWPLEKELLAELHAELAAEMRLFGHADKTTVWGKTHDNAGRMVLDQANVEGKTYTYSGKTTAPGRAFGPAARKALAHFAQHIFHCAADELWAHAVWYPDPALCKLGWHSDSEAGINPHTIMSVTFLDDQEGGVRPFDVRLKEAVVKKKPSPRKGSIRERYEEMFKIKKK
jgi:hypothetical protein